jgi:hypothetical protein
MSLTSLAAIFSAAWHSKDLQIISDSQFIFSLMPLSFLPKLHPLNHHLLELFFKLFEVMALEFEAFLSHD